jgi:hypothetical protein
MDARVTTMRIRKADLATGKQSAKQVISCQVFENQIYFQRYSSNP